MFDVSFCQVERQEATECPEWTTKCPNSKRMLNKVFEFLGYLQNTTLSGTICTKTLRFSCRPAEGAAVRELTWSNWTFKQMDIVEAPAVGMFHLNGFGRMENIFQTNRCAQWGWCGVTNCRKEEDCILHSGCTSVRAFNAIRPDW